MDFQYMQIHASELLRYDSYKKEQEIQGNLNLLLFICMQEKGLEPS